MIQAGLHPNPLVGWEQDTIGPGIQGYKGPYINQMIITGGKLKLQRSAAAMEFDNAQIAYQKMRIDVATGVRGAYFDLLVAKKRREMQRALVRSRMNCGRRSISSPADKRPLMSRCSCRCSPCRRETR
ncbi:MAG: TolC family protein [Planctomycetaceae bacterium]